MNFDTDLLWAERAALLRSVLPVAADNWFATGLPLRDVVALYPLDEESIQRALVTQLAAEVTRTQAQAEAFLQTTLDMWIAADLDEAILEAVCRDKQLVNIGQEDVERVIFPGPCLWEQQVTCGALLEMIQVLAWFALSPEVVRYPGGRMVDFEDFMRRAINYWLGLVELVQSSR